MKPGLGALVVAIAVASYVFGLTLPFAQDDYNLLSHVERLLDGDASWKGFYCYRPASWMAWGALIKLNGGFASPLVLHAALLVIHAVVAFVLYRVLAGALPRAAAFAGAALFALMPGGAQAVTWVAGGADSVALLFLLVAILGAQRFARCGSAWALPVIAGATFLSFVSKEPMLSLLPAAAIGFVSVAAPNRSRRVAPFVAAALGLGAGLALRWARLGVLNPAAYAYDVGLDVSDTLGIHAPFLQLLVPWNQDPAFAGMEPRIGTWIGALVGVAPLLCERVAVLGAASMGVLCGVARDVRALPRVVALGAALAIAFVPIAAAWNFALPATNTLSRAFYGPAAIFCAMLATGLAPVAESGGRRLAAIAVAALTGIAVLQADLLVHVARTERFVADRIRSRLQSLEDLARADATTATFVAVDPVAAIGGIGVIGPGVMYVLDKPFSRAGRKVAGWVDLATVFRAPAFRAERGPLRVLAVQDDRFVPVRDVPPIPDAPPALVRDGDGATFALMPPVPARAVAAVRGRGSRQGGAPGTVTFVADDGHETSVVPVGGTEPGAPFLALGPEEGWRVIRQIRFNGFDVEDAPEVVTALPAIELVLRDPIVRLGGAPRVAFRTPVDSPQYRVTFDFALHGLHVPIVYVVPRARFTKDSDGFLEFVPAVTDRVEWPGHQYHVTWASLPDVFGAVLAPGGVQALAVQFRVHGVGADGVSVESASDWLPMAVLAK